MEIKKRRAENLTSNKFIKKEGNKLKFNSDAKINTI